MSRPWIGSIWKPVGISSFKSLGEIKRKFGTNKVGHMGTLDPLAEGIMPFALGKYTKLIQYINLLPKIYFAEITFGVDSETLDAEGVNHSELDNVRYNLKVNQIDKAKFLEVLDAMVGNIKQKPPIFSALKIGGVKAYNLARKGKKIEMELREVECFSLDLLNLSERDGLVKAELRVECGKGYYVRSLVRDVCLALGLKGFMSKLVRERVGNFNRTNCLKNGFKIDQINWEIDWNKILNPSLECLELDEDKVDKLRNGLQVEGSLSGLGIGMYRGDPICIFRQDGIGKIQVVKNL